IWQMSNDQKTLESLAVYGLITTDRPYANNIPMTLKAPGTEVAKSKKELWFTRDEFKALFPDVAQRSLQHTDTQVWAVLPMRGSENLLGVISFSFPVLKVFTPEEQAFIRAIVQQCAQAFERARLYEAEQTAHASAELKAMRLTHLQQLTNQLSR